ncbi:hypothetical protein H2200_011866 [Cladophialophora chaetospira]|uniref:Uncharacterized protein n=1 Tax=Cladophialophora chaetospira TaxID=386627 RepID=A0AA39CCX6_9EURO|nr:hypothetical protein H2200_011866 [Cladophialophora chaetospira]
MGSSRPSSAFRAFVVDDHENLGPLKDGRRPGTPRFTPHGLDVEEFRVGGPSLVMQPADYLYSYSKSTALEEKFKTSLQALNRVLRKEGFDKTSRNGRYMRLEFAFFESQVDLDAPEEVYLFLRQFWSPGCLSRWIHAADLIFLKLHELGLDGFKVLVGDEDYFPVPYSAALKVGDALLSNWPEMADRILDAIAPNKTWLSVDLLWRWTVPKGTWRGSERVGEGDNDFKKRAKTKVVLLIERDSTEEWDAAVSNIRAVIASNPTYKARAVELEIIRGALSDTRVSRSVSRVQIESSIAYSSDPQKCWNEEFWNEVPHVGSSICPSNGVGAAAFCCAITLDESLDVYALTAGHVFSSITSTKPICENRLSFQEYINPRRADLRRSGGLLGPAGGKPFARMPAKVDLEDLAAYFGGALKENEVELSKAPHVLARKDYLMKRTRYEATRSRATALLGATSGIPVLGDVTAISGFRKDSGSDVILDWALIRLPESKAPVENVLPGRHTSRIHGRTLTDFAAPSPGDRVLRTGRWGESGSGVVNPALTRMRWPRLAGSTFRTPGRAWIQGITPIYYEGRATRYPFGHGGDSGAAVFTKWGEVVGMFLTGSSTTFMGYMMSSPELVKDIKDKTGAEEVKLKRKPEDQANDLLREVYRNAMTANMHAGRDQFNGLPSVADIVRNIMAGLPPLYGLAPPPGDDPNEKSRTLSLRQSAYTNF